MWFKRAEDLCAYPTKPNPPIPASELEPLRRQGDPLADEFTAALQATPSAIVDAILGASPCVEDASTRSSGAALQPSASCTVPTGPPAAPAPSTHESGEGPPPRCPEASPPESGNSGPSQAAPIRCPSRAFRVLKALCTSQEPPQSPPRTPGNDQERPSPESGSPRARPGSDASTSATPGGATWPGSDLPDSPELTRLREAAQALWSQASEVPAWLDRAKLREGQRVFLRDAPACFFVLLYGSLTGGFAAPWIVPVLKATGYLTGDPDSIVRRLFETTSFVVDVVNDKAFGEGTDSVAWQSALAVRLLHSQVRIRLQRTPFWQSGDPAWGVPINQEDMAVTNLSFSYVVLQGLSVMGLPPSAREREAFLHLWRYAGLLLGVEDRCNYLDSEERAKAGLDSILAHILVPDETSAQVALKIHSALGGLPGAGSWPSSRHAECSRFLIGDALADALQLPRGTLCDRCIVRSVILSLRALRAGATYVPGMLGWLLGRNERLCRVLIRMTIQKPASFEPSQSLGQLGSLT